MPSRSAVEFAVARAGARLLIAAAGHPPATSPRELHKASCLHAALAMSVAAWEAYLERLVREVQQEISDTSQVRLSAVLGLLKILTEKQIKLFNTPNADNARTLLYGHTGYDPINDWHWPSKSMSGIQTRQRLDEILRVRHSFAHSFPIPTDIQWAKNRNNPGMLNIKALKEVDSFLSQMVKITDSGMSRHLSTVFGLTINW